MYHQDFYTQCQQEFCNTFRESMGFHISYMDSVRHGDVYKTIRATPLDVYTPVVDFMMRNDGKCMLVVSGNNEDDEFVEIGLYELETRDIEHVQIVLRYIMVSAVLRFHEGNKLQRTWGISNATITDEM